MSIPEHLEVEVFRAGDYGPKGTYTEDDLERIAEHYNPATHEAPVTMDHDQRGPAHGWVRSLRRVGDRLLATLVRLSEPLRAALEANAYKKRSVELYRALKATGTPYLKAVSFLGAAAPEVKGLADPVFDSGEEVLSFEEDCPSAIEAIEEPPEPPEDPAEEARRYLIERGAWRPEWEEAGVGPVFQQLPDQEARAALLRVLESASAPVSFGAIGRTAGGAAMSQIADRFGEGLVGAPASQSSLRIHREAVRLLNNDPDLAYRDALLRACNS